MKKEVEVVDERRGRTETVKEIVHKRHCFSDVYAFARAIARYIGTEWSLRIEWLVLAPGFRREVPPVFPLSMAKVTNLTKKIFFQLPPRYR